MAGRRGGLGKGLDSLIPKKIKRKDFDENIDTEKDEQSPVEAENEKQEVDIVPVVDEADKQKDEEPEDDDLEFEESESEDDVNPFALEVEEEEDFEAEDEEEFGEENEREEKEEFESDEENEKDVKEEFESDAANENDLEENAISENENARESDEANKKELEEETEEETDSAEDDSNVKTEQSGNNQENREDAREKQISEDFTEANTGRENAVIMMRTSNVEPNRQQPRKKFNDATIEELAESIRQYGVIQPLLVQKRDDYYEIVAGERRWRAAKKASLKEIPVIIRDYSSQEAAEIALIENIQREDLNPIEEAQAYDRLIREFSMTQEEVASKVARSRSSITNSLRLLRLCEEVRDMVIRGDISEGHARAILALPSPGHQKMLAEQVVNDKLSVRETEKLIRKIMKPAKEEKEPSRDLEREAALGKLSEKLANVLGTRVKVSGNSKGKGKIEIEFYSDEELERIYELIQSVRFE